MLPKNRIKNKEVESIINYDELIDTIEEALYSCKIGQSNMASEGHIYTDTGDIVSMPARVDIDKFEYVGVKWISWFGENKPPITGNLLLNDPDTGENLCIMEAEELTAYRTAAISALATDNFAVKGDIKLGIVGLGKQSGYQLEAIKKVRNVSKVIGIDIESKKRKTFEEEVNIDVQTSKKFDLLRECDVISTVTPSKNPIIHKKHLKDKVHINAMGSDSKEKKEISDEVLISSSLILDSNQAKKYGESSNIPPNKIEGDIGKNLVYDNNINKNKRTVFDSVGLPIQDVAAGGLVYHKYNQ